MKYKSQKVAYWFFALSMLLLVLQITYGFIMGFARIGFDNLHDFIPFNTARAVHTNLLVVWLLSGFMGAAYYIIPEEAQRELVGVKWAYVQLISLAVVGVVANAVKAVPIVGPLTKAVVAPYTKTPVNVVTDVVDVAVPGLAFSKSAYYAVKGDRKKSLEALLAQAEDSEKGLKRTLGAGNLVAWALVPSSELDFL